VAVPAPVGAAGGVDVAADPGFEAGFGGSQDDSAFDVVDAARVTLREPAAAEVTQRQRAQIVALQPVGHGERALGMVHRGGVGLGDDTDGREVAVCAPAR
jgi:hypothetical protein